MSATIRMIGCAVALAATASLGPAQAQQSQAWTWCYASEADGVSLDLKISGCSTVIQSGKISNSDLALAYNNRGFAYGTKGQHDRAIQDYDQAIKLDPSDAIAYYNRGIAYSAKGQLDRAIQDYDQAIKLDPNYAHAFYNRGNAYSAKGQHDRAIQDYDQAIKLNPSDVNALLGLTQVYAAKGQYEEANRLISALWQSRKGQKDASTWPSWAGTVPPPEFIGTYKGLVIERVLPRPEVNRECPAFTNGCARLSEPDP